MEKSEYYNGDILEIKEEIDTFNQYKDTNPEIKKLVEENDGELVEAFGRLAISAGLNEKFTHQFIVGCIDILQHATADDTTEEEEIDTIIESAFEEVFGRPMADAKIELDTGEHI